MTYTRDKYSLIRHTGTVTHVCDGDTLDVEIAFGWFGTKKETIRIRFAGMDTPELRSQDAYAKEAEQYVVARVLNRRVSVLIARLKGSGQYVTGTHGRVVGVIYPHRFRPSLNVKLVKCGLAKVYPRAMCTWMTDKLWRDLKAAETYAKRKHLNIWTEQHILRCWDTTTVIGVGLVLCLILIVVAL